MSKLTPAQRAVCENIHSYYPSLVDMDKAMDKAGVSKSIENRNSFLARLIGTGALNLIFDSRFLKDE